MDTQKNAKQLVKAISEFVHDYDSGKTDTQLKIELLITIALALTEIVDELNQIKQELIITNER